MINATTKIALYNKATTANPIKLLLELGKIHPARRYVALSKFSFDNRENYLDCAVCSSAEAE